MSKTPWTPGPWAATRSNPHDGVDCWWITGGGGNREREVGTVYGGSSLAPADAALIALAPELAEAGEAVIAALQRSPTIITDQDVHSALNALASVLDRIRGDAP